MLPSSGSAARESAMAFRRAARCSAVKVELMLRLGRMCRFRSTLASRIDTLLSACPKSSLSTDICSAMRGIRASPL